MACKDDCGYSTQPKQQRATRYVKLVSSCAMFHEVWEL